MFAELLGVYKFAGRWRSHRVVYLRKIEISNTPVLSNFLINVARTYLRRRTLTGYKMAFSISRQSRQWLSTALLGTCSPRHWIDGTLYPSNLRCKYREACSAPDASWKSWNGNIGQERRLHPMWKRRPSPWRRSVAAATVVAFWSRIWSNFVPTPYDPAWRSKSLTFRNTSSVWLVCITTSGHQA